MSTDTRTSPLKKYLMQGVFYTEISFGSSRPEEFLGKTVLKICSKFTGEQPCRSAILIQLLQLYWNHTSAWVFSRKFAAYFQNNFSYEYLWAAASDYFNSEMLNLQILQYFKKTKLDFRFSNLDLAISNCKQSQNISNTIAIKDYLSVIKKQDSTIQLIVANCVSYRFKRSFPKTANVLLSILHDDFFTYLQNPQINKFVKVLRNTTLLTASHK